MKLKKTKLISTLMLGLTLILTNGCKKEDQDQNEATTPTTSEYFIEGKVNNVLISAGILTTETTTTSCYNEGTKTISMQRIVSDEDQRGWDIYIIDVELDNWQVPDTLDASRPNDQTQIQVFYYSGIHSFSDKTYKVDPIALGNSSFQMIVTSKSDDIIQGTFHGTLKNDDNPNLVVNVTEGRFKIKINRY